MKFKLEYNLKTGENNSGKKNIDKVFSSQQREFYIRKKGIILLLKKRFCLIFILKVGII